MNSSSWRDAGYQILLLVGLLAAWEAAVQLDLANAFWISSPLQIAARFDTSLREGELLFHTSVTVGEALAGLAAGSIVGVILGFVLGVSPTLGKLFEPFIIALNSLPRVALGPLIVMYAGIGFASKFLLASSLVLVPVMLNTFEGVRSVDRILVDLLKVLGATRAQLFVKLVLPTCIPWIFSALRISIAFAIIGAIVGEFISSRSGIGYMIDTAAGGFDTTGMMMPLFVLMVLAFGLDRLIVWISNRLLRWRPNGAP
jgi:NitT/TauT family transport system permease protein